MDKQELIDSYIVNQRGIFPPVEGACICINQSTHVSFSEFQQRARELGYINGYRWGVEYPTNCEEPDLPDDVVVCIDGECCASNGDSVDGWDWSMIKSFNITDQRYKPVDASYLDKTDSSLDNGANWYDYDNQKALRLPPVGVECGFNVCGSNAYSTCVFVGLNSKKLLVIEVNNRYSTYSTTQISFYPLDWNRKKHEAIEAASKCFQAHCMHDYSGQPFLDGLAGLYDAGFLRLPPQKD